MVSITLALIAVIDRLLTLLRQRSELLELTIIRLQWDSLRWQIMHETAQVRAEIQEIARGKGRWKPPTFNGRHRRSSTERSLVKSASGASIASGMHTLTEDSPASSPPLSGENRIQSQDRRESILSVNGSPGRSATPRKAHRLPLLHSHIVTLEIRQRNLASTLLVRSGKTLDKMIDLSIPLKDLGGVKGPQPQEESHTESGAVPDDLLDIQDDLELGVNGLAERVGWCKELELLWSKYAPRQLARDQAD